MWTKYTISDGVKRVDGFFPNKRSQLQIVLLLISQKRFGQYMIELFWYCRSKAKSIGGEYTAQLYQHKRLPSLMWQHALDEVQKATVEAMERKENKHFTKAGCTSSTSHHEVSQRYRVLQGRLPKRWHNSAHIMSEKDQSWDEELGKKIGIIPEHWAKKSIHGEKISNVGL